MAIDFPFCSVIIGRGKMTEAAPPGTLAGRAKRAGRGEASMRLELVFGIYLVLAAFSVLCMGRILLLLAKGEEGKRRRRPSARISSAWPVSTPASGTTGSPRWP